MAASGLVILGLNGLVLVATTLDFRVGLVRCIMGKDDAQSARFAATKQERKERREKETKRGGEMFAVSPQAEIRVLLLKHQSHSSIWDTLGWKCIWWGAAATRRGLRWGPAEAHWHIHEEQKKSLWKTLVSASTQSPRAPSGRVWNHSLPLHTGVLWLCDLSFHTQMFGWRQAAANQS